MADLLWALVLRVDHLCACPKEKKMDEELARAKELNKQKKKQQALLALKKKKMYEAQVGGIGSTGSCC